MALSHNLLNARVQPNHDSLVQHKIWKGEPDLTGHFTATVRGVESGGKGEPLLLHCVDPHGNMFVASSAIVQFLYES